MRNPCLSRETIRGRGAIRSKEFESGCARIARRIFFGWDAIIVGILVFALSWPSSSRAYAVLAHEAIIDAVWETHIKPLLLARFPGSTEEQLSEAQAYAYGGSIIQDMGYYPYGSHFFST